MKKLISLILIPVLLCVLLTGVLAADSSQGQDAKVYVPKTADTVSADEVTAEKTPEPSGIDFVGDFYDTLTEAEELRLETWAENLYQLTGIAACYAVIDDSGQQEIEEWAMDYISSIQAHGKPTVLLVDRMGPGKVYGASYNTPEALELDISELIDAYGRGGYEGLNGVRSYLDEVVNQLKAAGYDITHDQMIGFQAVEQDHELVVDLTGTLSEVQLTAMRERAAQLTETYCCEVSAVLTDTLEGKTAQAWADDYYDYNGYGYGDDDSGIMFVVDVVGREYADTTYGYGITAFTDNGLYYLERPVVEKLKESDWAGAIEVYMNYAEELLQIAAEGEPFDEVQPETLDNAPFKVRLQYAIDQLVNVSSISAAVLFGLICGMLFSLRKTRKLAKKEKSTVQLRSGAHEYAGTYKSVKSWDKLLREYQDVKYSPVVTSSSGGSSGSSRSSYGGSSTHVSSSGRSHGGHSGRF